MWDGSSSIYSFHPTQDDHILEWHEILGNVVRWNKVEMKKVGEYFNKEREEVIYKIGKWSCWLGQKKKEIDHLEWDEGSTGEYIMFSN